MTRFAYTSLMAGLLAFSVGLSAAPLGWTAETTPSASGRAITVQVLSSTPAAKPVVQDAKTVMIPLNQPAKPAQVKVTAKPTSTSAKVVNQPTKPVVKPVVSTSPGAKSTAQSTQKVVTPPKATVNATTPVKKTTTAASKPVAKPTVAKSQATTPGAQPIAAVSSKPTELKGTILMLQPAGAKPQPAVKEPPAAFLASDDAMLIRTVPLAVNGYAGISNLSQQAQTPEGVVQLVSATSSILPHMEVIRQAQTALTPEAKQVLLTLLRERYVGEQDNPTKYFDYGYAQLVLEGNKNGLFFLRKANDKLNSPATSLAYGMAQVDVDRLHEKAQPVDLTTRKMDAGYKLKDALVLNRVQKLPGIWPTYVHIMDSLKSYSAFESLRTEDVSAIYVPVGNVSLSRSMPAAFLAMPTAEASPSEVIPISPGAMGTCPTTYSQPTSATPAYTKKVDILNKGELSMVNFYSTQPGAPYLVQVQSPQGQLVGEFTSYKAPYIMEDLDGDNQFELVVRQFEREPLHPVYVYRWSGSCFAEDMGVSAFFR